ncbi:MAG TPA: lysophospholipid acyltransferase family protein [Xanthobacteraceae bacterium]|jgi:1-acyl-sn-glycerol-3-phosphate acyltransferase|nr:lysophospholipid acyltransferase family protein [Xanthobacteraceae bacterium]
MLRLPLIAAAIILTTIVLLPLQAVAVTLGLPMRRSLPVFYHRLVCALIGIRIHLRGIPAIDRPLLIVSNHVSWLDICVIGAIAPVVFIAKSDVANWPVFGWLARLQRSIFVDRQRRHKTAQVNAQIVRRLAEGDPVVLFAEGTSSDGNRVLPFRSALVGAAQDARIQDPNVQDTIVQEEWQQSPVFIQPTSIAAIAWQGLPLGRQFRPAVAWYGDLDLMPHLKDIIRLGAFDIVVTFGDPIAYGGALDRKSLAKALETTVRRMTSSALRGGLSGITSQRGEGGHSFRAEKSVDYREDRDQNGMPQAPECSDMRPRQVLHVEPRPESTSTRTA